jgi:4-hydroxybenzoate polyprenyltransferase
MDRLERDAINRRPASRPIATSDRSRRRAARLVLIAQKLDMEEEFRNEL